MVIPSEMRALVRRARRNASRAHAPYSAYRVGSVLETVTGELFDGANVENASFPLGCCAERVALAIWRARSDEPIRRLLVWTDSDPAAPPCGLCRDAILAWAEDAEIWLVGPGGVDGPLRPADLVPGSTVAGGVSEGR